MVYPKPYMSITELINVTGLSRDYLKRVSGIHDAPVIRTNGGGKIFFRTDELDRYLIEVSKRDEKANKTRK